MKIKGNENEDSFYLAGADLEQEMLQSRITDFDSMKRVIIKYKKTDWEYH